MSPKPTILPASVAVISARWRSPWIDQSSAGEDAAAVERSGGDEVEHREHDVHEREPAEGGDEERREEAAGGRADRDEEEGRAESRCSWPDPPPRSGAPRRPFGMGPPSWATPPSSQSVIPLTCIPLRRATTEWASSWASSEARKTITAKIATTQSSKSETPPVRPKASRPAMTSTDQWIPTSIAEDPTELHGGLHPDSSRTVPRGTACSPATLRRAPDVPGSGQERRLRVRREAARLVVR